MPLVLRSETLAAAPNGRPNSRLTVGVGESVLFRTDPERDAHWTVGGERTRNRFRQFGYTFNQPGEFTVRAEVGDERGELTVTVVAPSLRYEKVRDVPVPTGVAAWLTRNGVAAPADLSSSVGVAMELRVLLTPLSVSFAALQVRELDCGPDATWGVFAPQGMAPRHRATAGWTAVGAGNALASHDMVAASWNPADMDWPIPAGGYRWLIPTRYRVGDGGTEVAFPDPTPQTVRFTPVAGGTSSHGTFFIDKGGQNAVNRV